MAKSSVSQQRSVCGAVPQINSCTSGTFSFPIRLPCDGLWCGLWVSCDQPNSNFPRMGAVWLRGMSPDLMLLTAPPPARGCQGVGGSRKCAPLRLATRAAALARSKVAMPDLASPREFRMQVSWRAYFIEPIKISLASNGGVDVILHMSASPGATSVLKLASGRLESFLRG